MAIGIDSGSTWTKGAVVSGQNEILALSHESSGWDLKAASLALLERLKADCREKISAIAATGYGRARITEADAIVTEISAHALGAERLRPGVRTVIDVGGQDTKVIMVNSGKAEEFVMNDKCAAGAGRFLDMILRRLELGPEALDNLAEPESPVRLNSVCAVFAESEILSLLASGRSRSEALAGAMTSLAERTAALASRLSIKPPVVLTGGLSASRRFSARLGEALGLSVEPLERGFYAGAIGAAITALKISGLNKLS
jgi:predicted CoA-substrate-specific enzyme activase